MHFQRVASALFSRGGLARSVAAGYPVPRSGPYLDYVVNSDMGKPVIVDDSQLTASDFEKIKIAEMIEASEGKSCRPLWQEDPGQIRRTARLSLEAVACRNGFTMRFATRFINWTPAYSSESESGHFQGRILVLATPIGGSPSCHEIQAP